MSTVDVSSSPAAHRSSSVRRQVLRGLGWTAAGLFTFGLATFLVSAPGNDQGLVNDDLNGHTTFDVHPQWKATVVVAVVAASAFVVFRRLRRWSERPRWLLPIATGVLIAGSATMLFPFTASGGIDANRSCVALVDAWHPVAANPGPADWQAWRSQYVPLPRSPFPDRARSLAFYTEQRRTSSARDAALAANPEYQRAERYVEWSGSQSVCAPRAREQLEDAGAVLAGGSAFLAGAVVSTRRRTRKRQAERVPVEVEV